MVCGCVEVVASFRGKIHCLDLGLNRSAILKWILQAICSTADKSKGCTGAN